MNTDKELISLFEQLKSCLMTDEYYSPRNYKSIGGGWTTDTWKNNEAILRIMDEGYSSSITFGESSQVFVGFNGKDYIKFYNCSSEEFTKFANKLIKQ